MENQLFDDYYGPEEKDQTVVDKDVVVIASIGIAVAVAAVFAIFW